MSDPKAAAPILTDGSATDRSPTASSATGECCEPLAAAHPALYSQIFEMAADAQLVSEASGRIRLANRQAERLFGYSGSELLELSIEDLIPQRFRHAHRQHRTRYRKRPSARPMGLNLSLWALHRDGHEFPVEISLNPLLLAEETFICANVRDVSELHRARIVLSQARQTQAIADFGRLALSSQDLDSIQNEACRLAALNLEAPAALLLRRDGSRRELAIVAGSDSTAERVPNAGTHRWLAAAIADRISNEGLAQDQCTTFAVSPPDADDEANLLLCPIPGEDGGGGMLVALAAADRSFSSDDGSFLRALANTVGAVLLRQHTEERLFQLQRLEALGQLTGGVAHDFNNLLTIVSGILQMLEERLEQDPLGAKLVKSALRATGRGADLTRKLLAFSRRQTLQPRAIDIGLLLSSLAEILRRTLGARIEVQTVLGDDLPLAKADPGMLDTALLNLAVNARDAMPDGGRLTLEAHREILDADYAAREPEVVPGEYVQIAVSDTGTGMPPEVLSRAFEPFFTTKARGKGSGLGLSLVYGFANQSGGHLKVYSESGVGTSMKLYLPVAGDLALRASPANVEEIRGGNEKILIVEDDESVREVAVGFVERLGYRVLESSSADDALEQLDRNPDIALLFTDVVLRGEVDGPELAREALRRHPKLKVLFTSGYARNALPRQIGPDVSFELLSKPYRIGQLARMLRRSLDRPPPRDGRRSDR